MFEDRLGTLASADAAEETLGLLERAALKLLIQLSVRRVLCLQFVQAPSERPYAVRLASALLPVVITARVYAADAAHEAERAFGACPVALQKSRD